MNSIAPFIPVATGIAGAVAGAVARPWIEEVFIRRRRTLTLLQHPYAYFAEEMLPQELKEFGLIERPLAIHRFSVSNRSWRLLKDEKITAVDPGSDDTNMVMYFGFHQDIVTKCDSGRYSLALNGVEIMHFERGAIGDLVIYSNSLSPPKIIAARDLNLRFMPYTYNTTYGYGYMYGY